jgi:drug/metabolite transporter (DMT)-like permease
MTATQYISAAEVSMTMVLETVLATLWAFIFFNETPESNSLIGGGIILSAIIIYTWMTMQKPPLQNANT